MSEMIERVAKAIFEAVEAESRDIFYGRLRKITWEERKAEMLKDPRNGNPHTMAKAAIEAMKEPTPQIIAAMRNCEDGSRRVDDAWSYLIDAALKE